MFVRTMQKLAARPAVPLFPGPWRDRQPVRPPVSDLAPRETAPDARRDAVRRADADATRSRETARSAHALERRWML